MIKAIEYLFYAFLFLLPWQARIVLFPGVLNNGPWEYGNISLYAIDVLFLVIVILFIVQKVVVIPPAIGGGNPGSSRVQTTWIPSASWRIAGMTRKTVALISSIVLFSSLSIFWSSHLGVSAYAAVRLVQGIILFILLRALPLNRTRLMYALVAGAVVQAIFSIVQFSTQNVFTFLWSGIAPQNPMTPGVAVIEAGGRRWLRAYGSFPHPNILGGYFSIILILLLSYGKKMKNKYTLAIVSAAFIVIGLFLTFSRAAWIALFVGVVIWSIQHRAWHIPMVRMGGAVIIAIGIVYTALFWPLIASRVTGVGRLELKSTSERMQYIRESVARIRTHALLGVGIGNYTAAVHDEIRPNDPSWSYQPVHNVFLLIFAELGIVGLALFLLLFRPFNILHSAFIILLLLDHSFWTLHSGILLFWLAIALQEHEETRVLDVI